jgi:phosphomannomutase
MLMFFCFCPSLALDKPLEGLHIVVDAGNGAGGFFVVMCYTSKVVL